MVVERPKLSSVFILSENINDQWINITINTDRLDKYNLWSQKILVRTCAIKQKHFDINFPW